MCYQLLELYSSCRCLYYQHAVDRCDAYGRPGHTVQLRTILVGYACLNHTSSHGPSHNGDSARSKATSNKATSGNITENFIEKYFQRAAELGYPGRQLMSTSEQKQGPIYNMKSDFSVSTRKVVSHPVYHVFPLGSNQMRLMKVFPARRSDQQLTASLFVVSVDDVSVLYDALSYTWGDLTDSENIRINGFSMIVNNGLLTALRRLRRRDRQVNLWVDSICINQSDVSERNAQVAQMGAIYRRADRVRIWLGEAFSDSEKAMGLVNDCAKIRSRQEIIQRIIQDEDSAQALTNLLKRPYWTRMWVFQEIVLSERATIHCGNLKASWSTFKRLDSITAQTKDWANLHIRASWILEFRKAFFGIAQFCIKKEQARLAINVLQPTRRLQSKDPRDKIFALLGVCDLNSFLAPDYNLSTRDLYIASTTTLIEEHQDLSILLTSGLWNPENGEDIGLPSWVPDFRGAGGIDIQYMAASYLNYFDASRGTHLSLPLSAKSSEVYSSSRDILETNGTLLDSICKTVSLGKGEAARRNLLQEFEIHHADTNTWQVALRALFESLIFENATFHGGADEEECMQQKIRLSRLAIGFVHEAIMFMLRDEDASSSSLAMTEAVVDKMWPLSERSFIEEYQRLQREDFDELFFLREEYRSRVEESTDSNLTTIFFTTDGYIGRSLTQIKQGDQVAVLFGCRLPLILRKGYSSNFYHVVSPCYVSGIMFGELEKRFGSHSQDGLKVRKISLM